MELILGAIVGLGVLGLMAGIVDIFGQGGMVVLCLLIFGTVALVMYIQSVRDRRQHKAWLKAKEEQDRREEEQEEALYRRILASDNIPENHAKIFIVNSLYSKGITIPLQNQPAFVWLDGLSLRLLPVGPDHLPVTLGSAFGMSISVKCDDYYDPTGMIPPRKQRIAYDGPFAKQFAEVSPHYKYVLDRDHPVFKEYFLSDYRVKMHIYTESTAMDIYAMQSAERGLPLQPLIQVYGRYYLNGIEITRNSARELHEKLGLPYSPQRNILSSSGRGNHPRTIRTEIDAWLALYSDGLISREEYAEHKAEYLSHIALYKDDQLSRELTSLMRAGVISRGEAMDIQNAALSNESDFIQGE